MIMIRSHTGVYFEAQDPFAVSFTPTHAPQKTRQTHQDCCIGAAGHSAGFLQAKAQEVATTTTNQVLR